MNHAIIRALFCVPRDRGLNQQLKTKHVRDTHEE